MDDYTPKIAELSFHGIDYILKFLPTESSLQIEIEQKSSGECWRNQFTSEYLEEITQKTGNYKKYPIFLKMLFSSLSKSSDSVFLDILTFQDLQVLKTRKNVNSNLSSTSNTKRYLILTYLVEFDKVHYPLPLNYEENPDPETLKMTIKRLRTELDEIKCGKSSKGFGESQCRTFFSEDKDVFRIENEALKAKLRRYEEENGKRMGAVEMDAILKEKIELENEYENLKNNHIREIQKINLQVEHLQIELNEKNNEILKLQQDYANTVFTDDKSKKFKDHILRKSEESELSLNSARKAMKTQERELDKLQSELDLLRQTDKKQKIRIKQLEKDLEGALKKTTGKGVTDRLYSGSRLASPASSVGKRSISVPQRKGNFSRENSISSEGGWKKKFSGISSKNTPKRLLSSDNSIKKTLITKPKPKEKTQKTFQKTVPEKNLKKNYDKPWMNNSKSKTKKDDEEKFLFKKLEDLRKKNEKPVRNTKNNNKPHLRPIENTNRSIKSIEVSGITSGKGQNNISKSIIKNSNKENSIENIDERLNKLQNLLSMAKN